MDIDNVLDVASDFGLEIKVLEALVRKGWVMEDGKLSDDMLSLLPKAIDMAFDNCGGDCSNCHCSNLGPEAPHG
jgi:hypothetical protein